LSRVVVSGYFGFGNIGDEIIKDIINTELNKKNIKTIFLTN